MKILIDSDNMLQVNRANNLKIPKKIEVFY